MTKSCSCLVPDCLSGTADKQERFLQVVVHLPVASHYELDLADVRFLHPYGVVILFLVVRFLQTRSGNPVSLVNIQEEPYLYLERADFFRTAANLVAYTPPTQDTWDRNAESLTILELTTIHSTQDTIAIVGRAEKIFSRWLNGSDLALLVNVLSELCSNIHHHSEDSQGCAILQTYYYPRRYQAVARLAVGDLGCGIRSSLVKCFGEFDSEPVAYLRAALEGKSSRGSGRRGGNGLRIVRQIVAKTDGSLWFRSGTAAVCERDGQYDEKTRLVSFPGTQLAITLCTSDYATLAV